MNCSRSALKNWKRKRHYVDISRLITKRNDQKISRKKLQLPNGKKFLKIFPRNEIHTRKTKKKYNVIATWMNLQQTPGQDLWESRNIVSQYVNIMVSKLLASKFLVLIRKSAGATI